MGLAVWTAPSHTSWLNLSLSYIKQVNYLPTSDIFLLLFGYDSRMAVSKELFVIVLVYCLYDINHCTHAEEAESCADMKKMIGKGLFLDVVKLIRWTRIEHVTKGKLQKLSWLKQGNNHFIKSLLINYLLKITSALT